MKLDLSCPIELRGYTLSFADGIAEASVRLYNLTTRRIASFEAIAKWRSSASGKSVALPFCSDRLRAGGEDGFRINLSCHRLSDADQLELVFTSVRFEDGEDWRAGAGMIVEIEPLEPISASDLSALRTVAGEDAVCFPLRNDQTWRCICGRMNQVSSESCARCHRKQPFALGCTPENVRFLSTAIQPGSAQSEVDELQKNYFRQRTRLFHRTLATAIAALVLTVLLILSYQPSDAGNASAEAALEAITTSWEE